MTDFKNYHRRFIAEFIELYKSYPTLWNLKSPEYNDRDSKRDAYVTLIKKLQEIEPKCTKQDVIKKINSLRSAFRREYRKVTRMRAVGKLYNPTLWYYDLISFTINGSRRKFRRVKETNKANPDRETPADPLSLTIKQEDDSITEDYPSFETDERSIVSQDGPSTNSFKHGQDEFDAIGYNVASKLRKMDRNQRIIAERIIAETLFQGQMGILSVNTSSSDFVPTLVCDPHDVKSNSSLPP
ncbi:uncharacterized protein LOC108905014 [Anoplophora glabripennis]|uniref:uncharacterized protein LOC108905014 n=1 Tax=Anoplophora glabripennis TaxID=217634 RepID=UPI0008750C9D|nr:uncharacterized protein LOC108905014 [Anoplophora glabripennis]